MRKYLAVLVMTLLAAPAAMAFNPQPEPPGFGAIESSTAKRRVSTFTLRRRQEGFRRGRVQESFNFASTTRAAPCWPKELRVSLPPG